MVGGMSAFKVVSKAVSSSPLSICSTRWFNKPMTSFFFSGPFNFLKPLHGHHEPHGNAREIFLLKTIGQEIIGNFIDDLDDSFGVDLGRKALEESVHGGGDIFFSDNIMSRTRAFLGTRPRRGVR